MPTCSSCEQKLAKSQFASMELRLGPDRRCKSCIEATESLFKGALSTRRFDEVSTDAQVERLRSRDPNTQMDAANKLWTLTRRGSEATDRDIANAGAIRPLVELLRTKGDDRAWTAAMTLQALSCRSDARKTAIGDAGAVPLLVALLGETHSEDDREVAAMVLHNLAFLSGPDTGQSAVVIGRQMQMLHAGAVAKLVPLLGAPEDGAREAAAGVLACMVSGSDEVRDCVVAELTEAQGVAPLAMMVRLHEWPDGRHDAARVLAALGRHDDEASSIAAALGYEDTGSSTARSPVAALPDLLERLALGRESDSDEDIHSEASVPRGSASSLPAGYAPAAVAMSSIAAVPVS